MLTSKGIYNNGTIKLERELSVDRPVEVSVTFLDDVKDIPKKRLTFSDFSFAESRKILSRLKSSLSDTVIEERRSEL